MALASSMAPKKKASLKSKSSKEKSSSSTDSGNSSKEKQDDPFERVLVSEPYFLHKRAVPGKIGIYLRSIHVREIWTTFPSISQFSNSNKKSTDTIKSSPSVSRSSKTNVSVRTSQPTKLSQCILQGIVVCNLDMLERGYNLYLQIVANLRYRQTGSVPPYKEPVNLNSCCYSLHIQLYPVVIEGVSNLDAATNSLMAKFSKDFGDGYTLQHFKLDLTGLPDSVFILHGKNTKIDSGLFWQARAYVARHEAGTPISSYDTRMTFFKYTVLNLDHKNQPSPRTYERFFGGSDGQATLKLTATLNKEVFDQSEEIEVRVTILNQSPRTTVTAISASVEQMLRFKAQIPHDKVVLLAQEYKEVNSKAPSVVLTLRPRYSDAINNLAVDGISRCEKNYRLASSTFVVANVEAPRPASPVNSRSASPVNSRSSSPKTSPKGSRSPKKQKSSKRAKASGEKSPHRDSTEKDNSKSADDASERVATTDEKSRNHTIEVFTDRQECRPFSVCYEVVVRCSLRGKDCEEAGVPSVRVPFLLTSKPWEPKVVEVDPKCQSSSPKSPGSPRRSSKSK